jgi:LacI family transcriptional regulator
MSRRAVRPAEAAASAKASPMTDTRRELRIWAPVIRPVSWSILLARGILKYARLRPRWRVTVGVATPDWMQARPEPPDGLIAPIFDKPMMLFVRAAECPVVDLSEVFWTDPIARVLPDDVAIGREAAAHLLGRGLRHFAAAGFAQWNYARRRMDAFAQAVAAAGFACGRLENLHADERMRRVLPQASRRTVDAWLRGLPKPCGLYAATDIVAAFCLEAAANLSCEVPGELCILGTNDDELVCEATRPMLSSVRIPWEDVGCRAAQSLDRLLSGKRAPRGPQWVAPRGVAMRASTDVVACEDDGVRKAVNFIRLHPDLPLRVIDVAKQAGMSRRNLERRVLAGMGRTVLQTIHAARLVRARDLLAETDMQVKSVASACGFSGPAHFSAVFRKAAGRSPSAYRRRCRQNACAPVATENGRCRNAPGGS